nr:secretin N-terminal domain-containing protein [uncultured Undibacterium sp.]
MAFREGKNLVEDGKVEQGLQKLQEALNYDVRNAEYRSAYLQTRERVSFKLLTQADTELSNNKPDAATADYQQVLRIDPSNDRAIAGLNKISMQRRHEQAIQDAKNALNQNDSAFASNKLRELLIENPNNIEARALQQGLQEKNTKPATETALAASFKKPITIEFKDVALKQIFEVISRSSGLNFLFDKDVKTDQKTSIFLKNSTIESAVHFTLLTNQLEQQVLDASTILIYPNTPAKVKDYQEMMVKTFFLANAEAKSVATTLKTILKIRDIVVDEKLNLMIVRDSPDAIRLAEKIIAMQDVPEPEVMLEVEILEIKRSRLQELGIKWPDSLNLTPLPSIAGGSLTLRDLKNNINSGTVSASIGNLTVNAKKQDSDVNLLANPRIRARNHEKAKIMIGERVPNVTTTTSGTFVSDSIAYLDVGLTLNVEPTVYLDNDVAIKVSMEVSSIVSQFQTKNGSSAYTIGTRSANTVLRLRDGENQVLAGLINDEDRRSATKIPLLGEVPILGRLFSTNADNNTKNEIVLSITPHIIRNIQRPNAAIAEFKSGTDSSFRTRPDSSASSSVVTAQQGSTLPITENTGSNNRNPNGSNSNGIGSNPNSGMGLSNNGQNQFIGNPLNNPFPVSPQNNPISGTQLSWQGPTQTKVGEVFTLQLQIQTDQSINSFPLSLNFDTKALQLVGISEGTFLKQGGAQTNFTSRVDPNGPIFVSTTRLGDGPATSNGSVMLVNFKAIAASDSSTVQMLSATPSNANGQIIQAPLPTPFQIKIVQ